MFITKNIFTDFFHYLRKPTYFFEFEHNQKSFTKVLIEIALLFIFTFFVAMFLVVISNLVLENLAYQGKYVNEANEPLLQEILSEALITGFIEELCFRWYLKLSVLSVSLLFFGSSLWISQHFIRYTSLNFSISFIYAMAFATIVALAFYFIVKQNQQAYTFLLNLYHHHFPYIFYFSALFFGWIHIFNYSLLTPVVILVSPLITLPQISAGFTLGFIRMKYGMKWTYSYHLLHNILAILLFA